MHNTHTNTDMVFHSKGGQNFEIRPSEKENSQVLWKQKP